jgi:hypothetical protein
MLWQYRKYYLESYILEDITFQSSQVQWWQVEGRQAPEGTVPGTGGWIFPHERDVDNSISTISTPPRPIIVAEVSYQKKLSKYFST